jgi:hypothetical protein
MDQRAAGSSDCVVIRQLSRSRFALTYWRCDAEAAAVHSYPKYGASVSASRTTRVLIVANRTAATPRLLQEVRRRAQASACDFTLLIPNAPSRQAADWTLQHALPLLERAARKPVASRVGGPDPFQAVRDAVHDASFDQIIVSTLSRRLSRWLRRDLVHRVESLGLPVAAIMPEEDRPSHEQPGSTGNKSMDNNVADLMGAWKIMLPRDARRRDERRR